MYAVVLLEMSLLSTWAIPDKVYPGGIKWHWSQKFEQPDAASISDISALVLLASSDVRSISYLMDKWLTNSYPRIFGYLNIKKYSVASSV